MRRAYIIGISDSHKQWFSPEVTSVISAGNVFSGGKRHHEIVTPWLPADAQWIDIIVPLQDVFNQYDGYDDIVIFASGDPLFYGFANTILREFPDVEIKIYPTFNSLQMLAHRMCLPYHDMHIVSLTGRPWDKFDEAIINGEKLIGVLTDRKHTPQAIRQRMLDYGYDNYTMTIGENLGNEVKERITTLSPSDDFDTDKSFDIPNCLILQKTYDRKKPFGIPETDFALLDGRAKMITKMPVRLVSLSFLDLYCRKNFWDVGFCTGSVSIEAKLQFPHLSVTSFEIREEGRSLIEENSKRFGALGITPIIGDFLEQDVSAYPAPDAIFIGGYGGKLPEFIKKLHNIMLPDGCIVFNSVSEQSRQTFIDSINSVGMKITRSTKVTVDEHNPIYILKAE